MEKVFNTDKKIRLGVWGLGRGRAFIDLCKALNIEVVAGCDYSDMMRNDFKKICPGAFITENEDEFLAYDMDAVLVATYFFNHANDAIKALKAGKHVMSEVSAFFTPAEGVRLVEAVEQSGKCYCLAENYTDQFVKKLWQEGTFGELTYAEVDYVHECRALSYSYLYGDPIHPGNTAHTWRSWLNFHYYCTHSLGALIETTGNRPVKVTAPPSDKTLPGYLPGSEMGAMEPSMVIMDNGAIVRNLMGASTYDSHVRRFWGTRAFVDATNAEPLVSLGQCGRGPKIKLTPPENELTKLAEKAGHSGGDFWVLYNFANYLLNGVEHPWNIYKACDVTLTGIMAVKSQYQGGIAVDVPDFRDKSVREQYRNDNFAQQHLDPKKLFPDDQNLAVTKNFSCIMNELDRAWECNGVPLIISALDGMKLYPYINDEASKLAIQGKVRQLLRELGPLTETFKNAKQLIELYPDSLGSKALASFLESAYPEKMSDIPALRQELTNWLLGADLPNRMQLRMYITKDKIDATEVPPVPEGFTLRTYQPGDEDAYINLMKLSGFSYWNKEFAATSMKKMLKDGLYFVVENATGKLVATAVANQAIEGKEADGGEMGWVGVDPAYRGMHLAKIVCNSVLKHFSKNNYARAYLYTDDFRIPALKTYLKAGWLPIIDSKELEQRWDRVCKKIGVLLESNISDENGTSDYTKIFTIR